MCGIGRQCAAMAANVAAMTANVRQWPPMSGNGRQWAAMAANVRQWLPMCGNGRQCAAMAANVRQWPPMCGNGRQWIGNGRQFRLFISHPPLLINKIILFHASFFPIRYRGQTLILIWYVSLNWCFYDSPFLTLNIHVHALISSTIASAHSLKKISDSNHF